MDPRYIVAPQGIPVAPYSWEVSAIMTRANLQTERVLLRLSRAVVIVGMNPLIEITGTGFRDPTLNSIDCAIDTGNGSEYKTNAQGVTSPAGQRDGTFSSLASLGMGAANGGRLLCWEFPAQTDLGFTFRWKQATTYNDCIVRVTLYAQQLAG